MAGGPAIAEAVFIGGPWETVHQRKHLLRRTCGEGLWDSIFGRLWGGNEHPSKDDLKQKIITRYRHGDKIK